MIKNVKYGLVLTGGGTKGAFQIGVWKALKELKIDIGAIAGTSIGALNGALFLQDDTEKTENVYENINLENIIEINKKINTEKNIFNIRNIGPLAMQYAEQKGFANKPLRKLIEENIDMDKIYNSKIDFGLLTYSLKTHLPTKVFKNDITKEEMTDYLLASACFPVFKAQKIGENEYFDGGLYDNTPINLLIEKGYKNIIVVDITGIGFNKKLQDKNIYVKIISPSEDLGGTFEFDKKNIKKNIKLGYLDAMHSLNEFQGHIYYFKNKEFIKMLKIFNLNTIYGLEYAAKIYKIDKYNLYSCDEFFKILNLKHNEAEERYAKVKEKFNLKATWKLNSINEIFNKGLGLCLVRDLYMNKPVARRFKPLKHYINDYLISVQALIELQNYME